MKLPVNLKFFWKLLSKKISGESLKFFGLPTTKWRPCKLFVKLNENHLLMANIFKLHKYQTFGLLKMHNIAQKMKFSIKDFFSKCDQILNGKLHFLCSVIWTKYDLWIINSVWKSFGLRLTECRKCYFF